MMGEDVSFQLGTHAYALLNASTEAVYIMEADGVVLAANNITAQRFGLSSNTELLGQNIFDFLPDEVLAYRKKKFEEAVSLKQTVQFEDEFNDRIENHSVNPIIEGKSSKIRLAVISTDVTTMRRTDEDLRREQQRQIFYMESLPGFVFLLGKDYSIRYANRYFRQMFCRPKKKKCFEAIRERDTACTMCPAIRVFETKSPVDWEWTHEDGRTFQAYAHPMTDVDLEEVVMVMGIDITERKDAVDQLTQAQRYQQAILDNIPDIVWLKDDRGRFTAVNQAFVDECGVSAEMLLGKDDYYAWSPEVAKVFHERDLEVMRSHEQQTIEEPLINWTGEHKWVETVRIPIFTGDGKLVGLTGIARDITERKRAIDRLMYSHSEMEKHVRERTIELERAVTDLEKEIEERKLVEQRLEEARKKAEVATRAKSNFLANMSHEIRTPLNVILGMAELAQTRGKVEQTHALEMVRAAGSSLLTVINDVLDFSKIEAHKLVLETIDFDLPNAMKTTCEIHRIQARKKELELDLDIAQDVPAVLQGDPSRLRQVLNNLISNAVKFTRRGGVYITVELEPKDSNPAPKKPDAVLVRFSVRDTGIGIPEDKHEAIFESFQQADGSTTREFGGTGLGLSISRRLVELMGGVMEVHSKEGKGSLFSFFLPLAPGDPNAVEIEDAAALAACQLSLEGLNILLAEDNILNQELACEFLRSKGHTIVSAMNGQEALDILKTQSFDLVLMDIQMPVMDGETATRVIRSSTDLAVPHTVPIIAMTAHALIGDRERFLKVGMDGYISKPINLTKLEALIESTMAKACGESMVRPPGGKTPCPPVTEHDLLTGAAEGDCLPEEDLLHEESFAATVPEAMLPDTTIPDTTIPDTTIPDTTIPDTTIPDTTIPDTTIPDTTIPDTTIPDTTIPDTTLEQASAHVFEEPQQETAEESIDPEYPFQANRLQALEYLQHNEKLLQRLEKVFMRDTPKDLEDLKAAIETSDQGETIRISHMIKGSASTIGAVGVSEKGKVLEFASKAGEPEKYMQMYEALEQVALEFVAHLMERFPENEAE